jgi:molybdate transport system substrate-binding protein
MGMRRMRWAVNCVLSVWLGVASAFAGEPVRIFAASSLKGPLDEVTAAFVAASKIEAPVTYAASSAIAKQIEQGAPADIFISADLEWMDYLQKADVIDIGSRTNLLGNRLVLIASPSGPAELKIAKGFALAAALGPGRLAIADPGAVPAGKYAKASLTALGVWASVKDRLAMAENVRAALGFVARDEASLGIVYATDAKAEPKVRMLGIFPADTHPPIVYPAAKLKKARPDAAKFLAYLKGAQARAVFERAGFLVP